MLHFTSQAAPPPSLVPAQPIEDVEIRRRKQTPPPTPPTPVTQATVNEEIKKKTQRLRKRKSQYTASEESRKRANKIQRQKDLGHRSQRKDCIIALSFKTDLQKLKRDKERAESQIQNHYSRVKLLSSEQLRKFFAAKTDAEVGATQLRRSREVVNALYKYFTKETVLERLIEGCTVYGITASFINFDNAAQFELFKQCLINSNATSTAHWDNVLSSKENWIEEFGIDYAFRVSAADKRLFCERNLLTDDEATI
uniref:Uncharacterized protein n=1 Tax=Panagrolaimus superbus TaxID=310955 RepID=A0A914ZAB9_9BILA